MFFTSCKIYFIKISGEKQLVYSILSRIYFLFFFFFLRKKVLQMFKGAPLPSERISVRVYTPRGEALFFKARF